jgi:hypothetical protein
MPENEVEARTTALRSSAIWQAILSRNPFFACTHIEIRNKNFGRSLGERIAARHVLVASFVAEDCLAVMAQIIGTAAGLIAGLAVAVLLMMIPLAVAGFLFSAESFFNAGTFLLNQSWRHYAGWVLIGVTAFFCPYLLLGIPINVSLRFFRPIHHAFAAKKAWRELRRHRDNNDPTACMPDKVASRHFTVSDGPFFRLIKITWWVISRITVLIFGIATLATFTVLYLKLGAMFLKQDVLLMAFLGCLMLCGLCYPYAFLHSRMGAGALDHLINSLFQGESYREALGQALGSMGVD